MRKTSLDMVHELARRDERVVFIGSDLGAGTLKAMQAEFPDRYFMEGIAEQNLIGLAAGLAMDGFIPYINTIATFLTRRCLEQVAVDLCLHNLPVRLIASGGGMVYAPLGPTHCAIEDIALMRALPNMTVVAPVDAVEMRKVMERSLAIPGPMYIRLAKGGDPVVSSADKDDLQIGRGVVLREGHDIILVTTGIMAARTLAAAEAIAAHGLSCGVVHLHTLKPLDEALVRHVAARARLVVTVEEHVRNGGLGSAILECLADAPAPCPRILRFALPDTFSEHYGSQDAVLDLCGLTPAAIAQAVTNAVSTSNS